MSLTSWNCDRMADRVLLSPDTGAAGGTDHDRKRIADLDDAPRDRDAIAKAREAVGDVDSARHTSPEGSGEHNPARGQLPGTAGKMLGGGLEAGSTDFGSATAATTGGRTGFGSNAGRSVGGGIGAAGSGPAGGSSGLADSGLDAESPSIGAFGTSVNALGRPLHADARESMGGAVLPTGGAGGGQQPAQNVQDDQNLQPGSTGRSAAGTSIGTLGGGTMGTATSGQRDRPIDIVEGRTALVEGSLPGGADPGEAFQAAANAVPRTEQDISAGRPPESDQPRKER